MFIEQIKNNEKPYLRLVQAVRKPNKNGDLVSTKQVILNIGPLNRFDDGDPDYLYRLKNSFKAGNPLIPALLPYCSAWKSAETYTFLPIKDLLRLSMISMASQNSSFSEACLTLPLSVRLSGRMMTI